MRQTPTQQPAEEVAQQEASFQAAAPPTPSFYSQSVDKFGIVRWGSSSTAVDPAEEGARVYEQAKDSGYSSETPGRDGISDIYEQGKSSRLGGVPNQQQPREEYVPPSLEEYKNYKPPKYEPPMSTYGGPMYAPQNHPDDLG